MPAAPCRSPVAIRFGMMPSLSHQLDSCWRWYRGSVLPAAVRMLWIIVRDGTGPNRSVSNFWIFLGPCSCGRAASGSLSELQRVRPYLCRYWLRSASPPRPSQVPLAPLVTSLAADAIALAQGADAVDLPQEVGNER